MESNTNLAAAKHCSIRLIRRCSWIEQQRNETITERTTMTLKILTLVHTFISLAGIFAGFVVLLGLLAGKRLDGCTALFLTTTVATSATGFFFPVRHFMPS